MPHRYALVIVAATILAACGPAHESPPDDAGADTGADWTCGPIACDEGNPCVRNGCAEDGGCARIVQPKGTTCEGEAADPIHGECDGDQDAPSCTITEWTCLRNPPGTPCIGGLCDGQQTCCSGGCLSASNVCTFGAGSIGKVCP